MLKWIILISFLTLFFSSLSFAAEKAIVLKITGAIGPATQDYIERGLKIAAEKKASIVILQLDTPGGLETAMRGINQAIISSPIPVIAYVAPSGARAASAGTFIMYASHVAAMARGTNLGAASPINLTSPEKNETTKTISTAEKKAINDASAYIHSLAELRGRNANWAELAVRHAASLSAEEAKRLNVIDELADDYPQLLQKINGKKVTVGSVQKTIQSKDLALETVATDWKYEFLSFLTNPNIAYLLMLIAIYGLFFELSNPGLILPGVVGVISLLLVLYAFQLMPINYAGLALILVGIIFMLFEVYVSSFGIIGIGGVISFILGSILLFDVQDPNYQLTLSLIITMSAVTLTFFFIIVTLAIRSHKRAIVTGQEGLIGSEGVVLSVMNEQVVVRVMGEIWEARSPILLEPGQKIRVVKINGLVLTIEPIERR